jgi:large repetitive protein
MSRFLMRMFPVLLLLALALSGGAYPVAAQETYSISGRVINDLNGDGDMFDEDEPGLAGWHLRLEKETEDGQPTFVREATTDRSGRYSFRLLPPGRYSISIPCEGQPKLWLATAPNSLGEYSTTVEGGEDSGGIDFWLSLLSAPPPHNGEIVGRLVWDENADGVPDPSESGVAGWQVNASMVGGPKCFPQEYQVTYAGSDGSFSFTGLQPGLYDLGYPGPSGRPHPDYVFDAPGIGQQMPDGHEYFSFLPDVEAPENGSGSIAIGILDVSGTGSISGEIYADSNENGQQDAGEPLVDCGCWMGLMYRTPHGYSPVVSRATYTSSGGLYGLSGLRVGEYWIALLQPPGVPIDPPVGPYGFSAHLVTLKDGEQLANVDFGLRVQPGQPTRMPQPTLASTPTPDVRLAPPSTGSGGAPSDSGLAGFAAALAVAGALAVCGAALAVRRTRRFHR